MWKSVKTEIYKKYCWGRPNIIKYKELMQTTNEKIQLNLAIFTEKACTSRTELYTNL